MQSIRKKEMRLKLKSKDEIEIIAESFVKEYFYRNHLEDWKDIYNYKDDWKSIFKEVQGILDLDYKEKVELMDELLKLEKEMD